ncbi:hypothetical protein ACFFRR_010430 [Megaselia abdita]
MDKENNLGRKILGMNNKTQLNFQLNNSVSDGPVPNSMEQRNRLSNLFSQDMYSIWPYHPPYFSPVAPTPGFSMMPTPYVVPLPTQYPATIPTASGQGQHLRNSACGEPMLIQIGVQCVNQNNPVNINSLNDISSPVSKTTTNIVNNNTNLSEHQESSSSSQSKSEENVSHGSLNSTSFIEKCNSIESLIKETEKKLGININSIKTNLASGDGFNLSPEIFNLLTHVALHGSEIAEKLAFNHRNRPCFKKIDSLCARMKQDLIRPDGVLPNINSQGIAWAVKDFIFVFTRVINAWIIIKGYVYNTPEGLNRVKSALSPTFAQSFANWQVITLAFIEDLIKSFVSLDELVQSQKVSYQKNDNGGPKSSTPTKNDSKSNISTATLIDDAFDIINTNDGVGSLSKSYMYTMVEDSEETQRKAIADGSYFKTGTYNPIKKTASQENESLNFMHKSKMFDDFEERLGKNFGSQEFDVINQSWSPSSTVTSVGGACGSSFPSPSDWLNCDIRVLETNLSKFSSAYDPNVTKPLGSDLIEKLNFLIDRIMGFTKASLFFNKEFLKNYVPDFFFKHKDKFVDNRTILLKSQVGGYAHIFEVIHDLKTVIFEAKIYLKTTKNQLLENSIINYEQEVTDLLEEKIFENYQFDHINGDPNEILYNTGK